MLVAFLLYNDGIQTIIRMASIYGAEVGIDQNAQIAAFVLVQFVGVPCSFLFGAMAPRIGAKRGVFLALDDLCRHQPAWLLHDHGMAVLCSRRARRHRPGRQPGAQPVALRADDPEAQVVRVSSASSPSSRSSPALPDRLCLRRRSCSSLRAAPRSFGHRLFFVLGALVLTRVDVAAGEAQAQRQQAAAGEIFDRTSAFTPCF